MKISKKEIITKYSGKFCLGFSASNLAALKNVNDSIINAKKPGGISNRQTFQYLMKGKVLFLRVQ